MIVPSIRPLALLLGLALALHAAPFQNVGMGGGGALYVPACSPHDHNLLFVGCDMSGFYRSVDGGKSWRMVDKRDVRDANQCPAAFDPRGADRVYAASGAQLKASDDRGEHWHLMTANPPPWEKAGAITAISIAPWDSQTFLVGTGDGAWLSTTGAKTWEKIDVKGRILAFAFDSRPNKHALFAGTTTGVFRSLDNGKTWQDSSEGMPSHELRGFCGGADATNSALYCTLPGTNNGGQYGGGVYLSRDDGQTWKSAMGAGINVELGKKGDYGLDDIPQYQFIGMASGAPGTAYVTTRGTGYHPPYGWSVFRTDDYGAHWTYSMTGDPREEKRNVEVGWIPVDLNWGYGGPADGFGVCSGDPQIAMFTNNGELYLTRDGAKTWQCAYSKRAQPQGEPKAGEAWQTTGLEVTSCWNFYFDPHDLRRAYICYTDIGFCRSEDGGQTWRYSAKGSPWSNSFYQIAFDPEKPGRIFAACSNQHDIPTWMETTGERAPGGVCVSDDYGASWKASNAGLPAAPVTGIILDPKSPPNARVLYACVYGHGLYKSADGGVTWRDSSSGLGLPGNRHIYAVKLDSKGALYCTITGKRTDRNFAEGAGLYKSGDAGASWALISPPLHWVGDFDFDPRDPNVIYLPAASVAGHIEGGLYKTVDGGKGWKRIIQDEDMPQELYSYTHAFFVTVDPRRPDRVYFSAFTHGLFVSDDAGGAWREIRDIPFTAVNRVAVDPRDPKLIWVTTFGGGVWKGRVE